MAGWIKIHRDIATHWIFQDECKFKWWIDLLLMASYEDNKQLVGDRLVEIKRGQMIVSLSFLSKRWGKAKGTILKFLELLESDHMIDRCTDRKVTILTICKYESYQEAEKQSLTDEVNDCLPMTDRCLTELKKLEEVKEIYNTPTAHTYTREQEFINQYRREGRWSDACLILHLKSREDCENLFDRWILEYQHKGQTHQDYTDFKGHFIQWARITIQKEKSNGNADKQDKRRGLQVVANSVDDYEGAF
jgi:hypothetical protein